ncbi:Plasminogen activator inhibitor 1 RNAbinding proteinlike, partial [Caligus rogercresseyi]
GVKAVDKREGGGSHNWGTMEDEMKAEEDKANVSASEEAPPATHHHHSGEDRHGSEEEGDEERLNKIKTLTLEEWKAQEKEKREILPTIPEKPAKALRLIPSGRKPMPIKRKRKRMMMKTKR